jgi:hypothetical protein
LRLSLKIFRPENFGRSSEKFKFLTLYKELLKYLNLTKIDIFVCGSKGKFCERK